MIEMLLRSLGIDLDAEQLQTQFQDAAQKVATFDERLTRIETMLKKALNLSAQDVTDVSAR